VRLCAVVYQHRVVTFATQHPITDVDAVQPRQRQQEINGFVREAGKQHLGIDAGPQRQLYLGVEPGWRVASSRPDQPQHRRPATAAGNLSAQRRVASDSCNGVVGGKLDTA
jgi:hypothetical protein